VPLSALSNRPKPATPGRAPIVFRADAASIFHTFQHLIVVQCVMTEYPMRGAPVVPDLKVLAILVQVSPTKQQRCKTAQIVCTELDREINGALKAIDRIAG
jgi:hypothetical protein